MEISSKKLLLKDQFFNKEKVLYLAKLIKKVYPIFKDENFVDEILEKFPELELKERIFWITKNLKKYLPKEFLKALKIILESLPKELDPNKNDGDFGDFILSPFGHFVSEYGCNREYLKKSLNALEEMNKRFSTEFEIRDFLNEFENETFSQMYIWSKSDNYHLRRVASEGSRPKLPWAKKINLNYKKTIKILDNLYFDKTRYVTRSVANHLNDISKIDSDLVLKTLKKWKKSGKQKEGEMSFIIKHSLRTLVKKGNKYALEFLGFRNNPKIKIRNFAIKNKNIKIGKYLEFDFEIFSQEKENLMIDYKITYPTKHKKVSQKVFKIKSLEISTGESIKIFKKQLFRQMTTKKLYPGIHKLELQINGKIYREEEFGLKF